jgi:hypothetical protein
VPMLYKNKFKKFSLGVISNKIYFKLVDKMELKE